MFKKLFSKNTDFEEVPDSPSPEREKEKEPVLFHLSENLDLRILRLVNHKYKGVELAHYSYVIERKIDGEWVHVASRYDEAEIIRVYNVFIKSIHAREKAKDKYRKTALVDAFQFKGGEEPAKEPIWFTNAIELGNIWFMEEDVIKINTLEGKMIAKAGDYIIRGVDGEIYPCKKDIFERTYEKVE